MDQGQREGESLFNPSDKSQPRVLGIGSSQHLAHALSGGNSDPTYQNVRDWLYGKKYHHNIEEFRRYKALLETISEKDFLFAARLHFIDLVDAVSFLQQLVWAILCDGRRVRS